MDFNNGLIFVWAKGPNAPNGATISLPITLNHVYVVTQLEIRNSSATTASWDRELVLTYTNNSISYYTSVGYKLFLAIGI